MTTRYSHHPTPSPSPDLPPTKGPGQTGARDASCLEPLVVSFLFFKCIYSTNRSLLIDCTYKQQTTPSLTLTRSRSKGWVGVGDRARYVFFLLNSYFYSHHDHHRTTWQLKRGPNGNIYHRLDPRYGILFKIFLFFLVTNRHPITWIQPSSFNSWQHEL